MKAEDHEIEAVEEAFTVLQDPEPFDEAQIEYIIDFFENDCQNYDEDLTQEVFEEQESVAQALTTINGFYHKFSESDELMDQYRSSVDLTIKNLQGGGALGF